MKKLQCSRFAPFLSSVRTQLRSVRAGLFLIICSFVALILLSGCQEAENAKNDALNSYDNLKDGVMETKENIDNTAEGVKETMDNVKGTVDNLSETAGQVKDAADSVSDILD